MYHYLFGMAAIVLLALISTLFIRVFKKNMQRDCSQERREIQGANPSGSIISLNATLRDDILKEALDINLRQVQINEALLSGSFTENVEDALLKLESDRNENIRRSVKMGLIPEKATSYRINQQST